MSVPMLSELFIVQKSLILILNTSDMIWVSYMDVDEELIQIDLHNCCPTLCFRCQWLLRYVFVLFFFVGNASHFYWYPFHIDQKTHLNTLTSDFCLQCEFVQFGFTPGSVYTAVVMGIFYLGLGYDNNNTRVDVAFFDPFMGQCYDTTAVTLQCGRFYLLVLSWKRDCSKGY